MPMVPALFAYFGPETTMPLFSLMATVVGIVLMFGRQSLLILTRLFRPRPTRGLPRRSVPAPIYARIAERNAPVDAES
jgi:hypothetical protein